MPKLKTLFMISEYRKVQGEVGEKCSYMLFSLTYFHFLFPPLEWKWNSLNMNGNANGKWPNTNFLTNLAEAANLDHVLCHC